MRYYWKSQGRVGEFVIQESETLKKLFTGVGSQLYELHV